MTDSANPLKPYIDMYRKHLPNGEWYEKNCIEKGLKEALEIQRAAFVMLVSRANTLRLTFDGRALEDGEEMLDNGDVWKDGKIKERYPDLAPFQQGE